MDKQNKQRVEQEVDQTETEVAKEVPFFVRRLQKLPTFKSGLRGGQVCGVDDEC